MMMKIFSSINPSKTRKIGYTGSSSRSCASLAYRTMPMHCAAVKRTKTAPINGIFLFLKKKTTNDEKEMTTMA